MHIRPSLHAHLHEYRKFSCRIYAYKKLTVKPDIFHRLDSRYARRAAYDIDM